MTDDDKTLVERLRDEAAMIADDVFQSNPETLDDAADRIEALSLANQELRSENERLREALKDALSHCYNCSGDPHYIEEDEVTGDHLWTDCPVCRSARAALGDTK